MALQLFVSSLGDSLSNRRGHVVTVGYTEEQIKALLSWEELWLITEVPFANDACFIAGSLQDFSGGDFVRIQAVR